MAYTIVYIVPSDLVIIFNAMVCQFYFVHTTIAKNGLRGVPKAPRVSYMANTSAAIIQISPKLCAETEPAGAAQVPVGQTETLRALF